MVRLLLKMKKSIRVRIFFERNGFAVCSRLAEILGMKVKSVRLFFIYASFTTLLGGFVMYLTCIMYDRHNTEAHDQARTGVCSNIHEKMWGEKGTRPEKNATF